MLDELRKMTGGDQSRIDIYVAAFLEEFPQYCEDLTKAIDENDIEGIRYVAHISKPLSSMMGFKELYHLAESLEVQIRSKEGLEEIPKKGKSLLFEMQQAIERLK